MFSTKHCAENNVKYLFYDCSKRQVNNGIYRETLWWQGQAEGNKSIIIGGSRKLRLILHVFSENKDFYWHITDHRREWSACGMLWRNWASNFNFKNVWPLLRICTCVIHKIRNLWKPNNISSQYVIHFKTATNWTLAFLIHRYHFLCLSVLDRRGDTWTPSLFQCRP